MMLISICVTSDFHLLFSVAEGELMDNRLSAPIRRDGMRCSKALYAGVASLIMYGVRNVVMTDTATTTG